jgi:hypothetical protein
MSQSPDLREDPDNPGWFFGWVLMKDSSETHWLGFFDSEEDAAAVSQNHPGSVYFHASVRAGSDDYMKV